MPDESEVHGLLALMLLHDSRRRARFSPSASSCGSPTRTGRSGTPTRSPSGRAALDRALALRGRGAYVLQAAIASLQAEDRSPTGRRSSPCTSSCPA